ncbi:hematopoietic SH2 domain-containing protein homolog [Anguilla anguilla]|uniref:hematopoietic SH2 domain-containing protein homolog n=1 Tax=Anguilla anguilla TaxID=7936 RepID=UPI0015A89737|nr:hematopoietic SH2 domain-containing protein homolog [Anguilla anguilla]
MEGTDLQEKHDAALAWFSQFQLGCVIRNGVIPDWFHGIISRKAAEEMLLSKPAGYFLIRLSESRMGFTLSYRAEDRCRHFMIDVLKNGQYIIVGENINHRSLEDLVAFHRRVPILPFNELLTVACGQVSKDQTDYAELLFPQRKPLNPKPGAFSSNAHHNSNIGQLQPSPNMPPSPLQLLSRSVCGHSSQSVANTAVPTKFNPPGLYPYLDAEVANLTLQSPDTTNSVKPVPLPRKKLHSVNSVPLEQAPELPSRNFLLKRNEQSNGGPQQLSTPGPACSEVQPGLNCRSPTPNQQRSAGAKSVVAILTHLKRRSQAKGGAPEEHVYAELTEAELSFTAPEGSVGKEPVSEHVYQEVPGERLATETNTSPVPNAAAPAVSTDSVPEEYLTPPPFAPGY